ncbi:MAG TPA: tetratricopeptide repeat protein [Bacteroidales bacterium]|nr:tetratricopeptide repeat protein [Bacteroidales bacterium]
MPGKSEKLKQSTTLKKKASRDSRIQDKSFRVPSWAIYLVILITTLIYTRVLQYDFIAWDDDEYLLKNPDIKNFNFEAVKLIFTSFYVGHYQPFTILSYLFEYHLFGLNPLPFHLINILLHLVNVLLVYRLTEKLSGHKFTALFVSAMFAVHPMHVESVAWIAERKDVLYTLFYLTALLVYMQYLKHGYKVKHYLLCLLLFTGSLLSKSVALTLPVLMIAFDLYTGRKPGKKMFIEKIPFFALSVLFGTVALLSQKVAMGDIPLAYSIPDRIFFFTYTLAFYIVKLIAPFNLSAMHYYPETSGGALPWYFYASLPFLLLVAWWIIKKSPLRRENIFGIFFFLIVISIMLQLVSVGTAIVAERYTYVSYIGLFYIIGQWISALNKPLLKKSAGFLCVLFFLLFSYLTWNRISVWENSNVLFTDVIKKYPNSYHAYWARGDGKNKLKDYQGALQDYNRSIQLNPDFSISRNSRGYIFLELNDYAPALSDLNASILLDSNASQAYHNRGLVYDRLGDTSAAMRDYNKAISINPKLQNSYAARGILKARMGKPESALTDFNEAIILNPDDQLSYRNRAAVRFMLKDFTGALDDCNFSLKMNPKDSISLFNRGQIRLNLNDTAGACIDWNQALKHGYPPAADAINQFCK